MIRIGLGYDIHRFKKGRPLWLGCVEIPYPKGLEGHSDADVLTHAIIDALLGAASLPDIGHYFPPGDPNTKGISSRIMLQKAVSEIRKKKFKIENIDSVVISEAPKIGPHRDRIKKELALLLGIKPDAIHVKGKTNEGLDSIGRGLAMAAHAVVLLKK